MGPSPLAVAPHKGTSNLASIGRRGDGWGRSDAASVWVTALSRPEPPEESELSRCVPVAKQIMTSWKDLGEAGE